MTAADLLTQTRPTRTPPGTSWSKDERPVLAFDWGAHQIHTTRDGSRVRVYANCEELLADLDQPYRLVAEATFESSDPERRVLLIDAIRTAGHELYVFRPLRTARRRAAAGQTTKTHDIDARTIWDLAVTLPNHVYPIVRTPAEQHVAHRQAVNLEYNRVRSAGGKKELARQAAAILGPLEQQSPVARAVLGNASQRQYAESLLAAAYFAAQHSRSRDEFERLLGLSGSAYPSLLRSDVHHHHVRHLRKRNPKLPDGERLMTALRRDYATAKASSTGRGSAPPASRGSATVSRRVRS